MIELEGDQWMRPGFLEGFLGMAAATGKAVRWVGQQPLTRSQLAVVRAAAQVSEGQVEGDVGALALTLEPGGTKGGAHEVRVGLGRGVGQVLGAVLPALLFGGRRVTLGVEGSTHAPDDATVDHWRWSIVPLLRAMGAQVEIRQVRAGFTPAGGGRVEVEVGHQKPTQALRLEARGALGKRWGRVWMAHLAGGIAERQRQRVARSLGWELDQVEVVRAPEALSPGNALSLGLEGFFGAAVFSAVGLSGRSAESVAEEAIEDLKHYLVSGAPVSGLMLRHVLVPMLCVGQGVVCASAPDAPTRALVELAPRFFDVACRLERTEGEGRIFRCTVG